MYYNVNVVMVRVKGATPIYHHTSSLLYHPFFFSSFSSSFFFLQNHSFIHSFIHKKYQSSFFLFFFSSSFLLSSLLIFLLCGYSHLRYGCRFHGEEATTSGKSKRRTFDNDGAMLRYAAALRGSFLSASPLYGCTSSGRR